MYQSESKVTMRFTYWTSKRDWNQPNEPAERTRCNYAVYMYIICTIPNSVKLQNHHSCLNARKVRYLRLPVYKWGTSSQYTYYWFQSVSFVQSTSYTTYMYGYECGGYTWLAVTASFQLYIWASFTTYMYIHMNSCYVSLNSYTFEFQLIL